MDMVPALLVACILFPIVLIIELFRGKASMMHVVVLVLFLIVDFLIFREWWEVDKLFKIPECKSSQRRYKKMCKFSDAEHKRSAFNYFNNSPPWRVIPPNILNRFPFGFQPGCCPICGNRRETKPDNKVTERSMCKWCYDTLIANNISNLCFVCGAILPESKVRAQKNNPREVVEHIHSGPCTHLWTVIHNVSVGAPDMVAAYALPAPQEQLRIHEGDVMEAVFEDIPSNRDNRYRLPYMTTHKGKPVKVLS